VSIKIFQKESPVLREKAKEVPFNMFGKEELSNILKMMIEGLHQEADAVAIAAPQIGVSFRIFAVKSNVFVSNKKKTDELDQEEMLKKSEIKIPTFEGDYVFINPKIIQFSKKAKKMEEGCLSVRLLYGKVKRHEKTKIEAFDFNGKKITFGASGLLSQIFQHETDHLDGVLFIDKATNLIEITKEELEKYQKNHVK
jgi:peptide deformylase